MVTKAVYLFLKDQKDDTSEQLQKFYELFSETPHFDGFNLSTEENTNENK